MGLGLDLIVLAILALSIFVGYKRGLISVIFSLFAFIIALLITWILCGPITNLVIKNTEIDDKIKSSIVENGIVKEDETSKESQSDESINQASKYIENYVSRATYDAKSQIVETSADVISKKIVTIIVAIGLFVVVRILLIVIRFVANGVASFPLIKQFNKLGGLIYGVISGLFIIYVLLAVCFLLMSIQDIEIISEAINGSILAKFLYNNNFILNIIFKK